MKEKTMLEEKIDQLRGVVEVKDLNNGLYKIWFVDRKSQEDSPFIADESYAVVYLQAIINYKNI